MAEKRKIILDVDTGTDDAIAIMTAYLDPDIDLLAVCSVAGTSLCPTPRRIPCGCGTS